MLLLDNITIVVIAVSGLSLAMSLMSLYLWRRERRVLNASQYLADLASIKASVEQRIAKLEEELVGCKVQLEINALKLQRQRQVSTRLPRPTENVEGLFRPTNVRREESEKRKVSTPPNLTELEVAILRVLQGNKQGLSSRNIEQLVGKSREHTARVMNSLFTRGFVYRDLSKRPYVYSLPPVELGQGTSEG